MRDRRRPAASVARLALVLCLVAGSRVAAAPPDGAASPPALATEWVWLLERTPQHLEDLATRMTARYAGALRLPAGSAITVEAWSAESGSATVIAPTDPGRVLADSECLAQARREFRALVERRNLAARESLRAWQDTVAKGDVAAVASLYRAANDLRSAVAAGVASSARMRALATKGLLAFVVNEVAEAVASSARGAIDLLPERVVEVVRTVWTWRGAKDKATAQLKASVKKALENALAGLVPEDLEDVAAHLDDLADSLALLHAFWRPQRSDVPSMSAVPPPGARDPLVDPLWYDLQGPIASELGYHLAFSLAYADDDVLATFVDTLTWAPSDRLSVPLARDALRAFHGTEAILVTDRWTDAFGATYERTHTSGPPGEGDGDFPALRAKFETRRRAVEQEAERGAEVVARVLTEATGPSATDGARLRALGLWALVKRDARTLAARAAASRALDRRLLETLADKFVNALTQLGPAKALGKPGQRWLAAMLKKAGKKAVGDLLDERPETAFEDLDADVLAMVGLLAQPPHAPVLPARDEDMTRLLDPSRSPFPVACGSAPARPGASDEDATGLVDVEVVVVDPARTPPEVYRGDELLVVEEGKTFSDAVEARRKEAQAEWGAGVSVTVRRKAPK